MADDDTAPIRPDRLAVLVAELQAYAAAHDTTVRDLMWDIVCDEGYADAARDIITRHHGYVSDGLVDYIRRPNRRCVDHATITE